MLRKVCSFVSTRAINPFLEFQPIQVGYGFTDFNIQGGITTKPTFALVRVSVSPSAGISMNIRSSLSLLAVSSRGVSAL